MKKLRDFQWMTVSGLAREINVSQSTVTSILDRLEKHGYVQRSRNTADRRRVEVRLSRRGSEVLSSEPSLLHENFLARFRTLSDWEQTGLLSALQRVASMMDAPDQLDDTSVLSSLYFEEADGATLRDSSEHPENEPQ
jgi:DNA-binding MarR family transcriptional regulator